MGARASGFGRPGNCWIGFKFSEGEEAGEEGGEKVAYRWEKERACDKPGSSWAAFKKRSLYGQILATKHKNAQRYPCKEIGWVLVEFVISEHTSWNHVGITEAQ